MIYFGPNCQWCGEPAASPGRNGRGEPCPCRCHPKPRASEAIQVAATDIATPVALIAIAEAILGLSTTDDEEAD